MISITVPIDFPFDQIKFIDAPECCDFSKVLPREWRQLETAGKQHRSILFFYRKCTGADEIEFKLSAYDIVPLHTEGTDTGIWVLQDFGNVIVHIFNSESRDFYKLDKLYMDTTEQDISALLTED